MKEKAKAKIRKWMQEGRLSEYKRMDCLFFLCGAMDDISLSEALDAVDEMMVDREIEA